MEIQHTPPPLSIKTYKQPRWVVFSVSLAMIVVGFIGYRLFEYISQFRNEKFGNDDLLAVLFFIIGVVGGFICVISGLWILIAGLFSVLRRKYPQHFTC